MICVALLVAWAASEFAHARTFVPVGSNSGVTARIVPALLFDSRGYLWVGSREGLYRFDGHETRHFLPDSGGLDTVSDIDIRALYESTDGTVWIGTHTGGLNRHDPLSESFEQYRNDPSDLESVPDAGINALSEGPAGALWVAHQIGLSRLDRTTGKFDHFRHKPGSPDALPNAPPSALHMGKSGNLWIGTAGGGVARWNPKSQNFSTYDLAQLTGGPAERNTVYSLFEDGEGTLWCGTRGGLVRLQAHAHTALKIDLGDSNDRPAMITSLVADAVGRLWAASQNHGLLIVDPDTLNWSSAVTEGELYVNKSLPDCALTSLAVERGQVFVGTWGSGVYRGSVRDLPFLLLDTDSTRGLNNNVITSVMRGAVAGAPWLGSYGGGPQRADIGDRTITQLLGRLHWMQESGVLSLVGPVDGRMYAGTTHGLYEFSADGSQMALFNHVAASRGGIGRGYVTALLADGDRGLWLGLGGSGLQYFNPSMQSFVDYRYETGARDALGETFVTALLQGTDGRIWVGTRSEGLIHCRATTGSCERLGQQGVGEFRLSDPHVTSLFQDREGCLWVGTDGGGLNQLFLDDGKVAKLRHWTTEDGLLDKGILAIQEDRDDSLWLSSRNGLTRLQPSTGRVENFVPATGLLAGHFHSNASAADERYLYFGSADGLLVFPKGQPWSTPENPVVRITSVDLPGANGQPEAVGWRTGLLRLPYGQVFSVEVAVMDFTESPHWYAYRLDPSDDWTRVWSERQIIIHNLEPGMYSFQARGRDAQGLWGETEPLALEIIPPFWMTSWFRAAVIVFLMTLALIAHFTRQGKIMSRAREIISLSAQRERALEDRLGDAAELAVLTPRQKEILQLVVKGLTTREIAELLGVSIKTVEAHRANLMERLDIHDVPGLVRLAIRSGLISYE